MFDYLVVGAGFAGSVIAERLASQMGAKVAICDRRPHIGGNTYDYHDQDGILVHKYGPHIFHTASPRVFEYLSHFTAWRPYEHRVLAQVDGKLVPFPINRNTIQQLYGCALNESEMAEFFRQRAEAIAHPRTMEDAVVSKIGRELYEKFFANYTRKQWGLEPSQLDAAVAARVPARVNGDDRYFTDHYQYMPLHGYTCLFERMLAHPNIRVFLSADYRDVKRAVRCKHMIYTGPIDAFFDHRFGELPYRSIEFQFATHDREHFKCNSVINYPNEHAYTRITEFKYLTGQKHRRTTVVYEYPTSQGDPYYPVPSAENQALYARYRKLADATPDVSFLGRLGTYRYYNMDQVVAQSLALFERIRGAGGPDRVRGGKGTVETQAA
jgi:UDP-galactopyranose mutase